MKSINIALVLFLIFLQGFAQVTPEKDVLSKGHQIYCIAYSHDGTMIATGGEDRTVRIYKTDTWQEIASLKGLRDIPLSVCFSNDGNKIAAGGKDKKITVWNISTKAILQTLVGHKNNVMSIKFSPNNKYIATASLDKTIKLWDTNSGGLINTFLGHTKGVTTIDFSPNGDQLASGSADESVCIWNVKTGTVKKSISGHSNWVKCVIYSPDGSLIASGGFDSQIQIWDAISGKKLNTFLGHRKWVQTMAFSPDGNYLLSGGHDNIIILTDLRTGKMAFRSKKQSNFILSVDFNPNGETFASVELYSQKLEVWNARKLNIKPIDLSVAQKVSNKSGMIPKITWVSPLMNEKIATATAKINANIFSESSLRSIELFVNGQLFASKDRSELMLETAENSITKYLETVVLNEGDNTLMIKAKNIVGDGISEQITVNYAPTQLKMLSWLMPTTDNYETNNPNFELNALINPAKSAQTIYILVNNITQSTITLPAVGGMLAQKVTLNRGVNSVKLLIQTSEFTKETEPRTINLTQANKPLITWSLPATDTLSYISTSRLLAAVVSQIPLDKVEIKVNGFAVFSKTQLQETQYIIDQQIHLTEGQNAICIVATNAGGETISIPRLISYELPVQSNISWLSPSASSSVFNSILQVNACIQTKQVISKVEIFNNGIAVLTDNQLLPTTDGECDINYKRPIILTQGLNQIQIVAHTPSELINTEVINITYALPKLATITWTNPIESQVSISEGVINVKACVNSNIPINEITILANNIVIATLPNPIKNYEFCSYEVNQIIPLVKGTNTIIIKAKNASGETLSTPVMVDFKTVNAYRFALIIGNEDYSSFQAELESESDVDFALNDARSFKNTCIKSLGISKDNIIYLENARYIEMRKALKKINGIIQVTQGKAEVYAYYAGHGFPEEKTKEPYLVPVDGSGTDLEFSAVKLSFFFEQLTEYPAERVTVFLDACFSGGARNQGLVAARGVKVVPRETKEAVKKKLVVFTASSGNQTSLPFAEKKHGMFTYYLIKKLEESGNELTYKELSDYILEQVAIKSFMINSKKQEPQTNVSPEVVGEWKTWTFQ